MLGYWRSHADYQRFVLNQLEQNSHFDPGSLKKYQNLTSKLWILNMDMLYEAIKPCYSSTGRPALLQPEIFRVFVAMTDQKIPIHNWTTTLENDFVLHTICGLKPSEIPKTSSFYDFMNRIVKLDERPKVKQFRRKPKKKLKKGEKLPPKHPQITTKLVKVIKEGRRLNHRPELILQKIFAVIVNQSLNLGLIGKTLSVCGDGTCIETGACHYGKRICDCKDNGIYDCECNRKFSDPSATWGWDSHNERWFYGYTGYFLSTYIKDLKIDLPLYIRLVEAKRHDSVSALVALTEFKDLNPELHIDTFISDCASDNYATYDLLNFWNINAVIALNKTNSGNSWYDDNININDNGVPICSAGHKMVYWGPCIEVNRSRYKWRCPRVLGKVEHCPACDNCSPSDYGRVFYTKFNIEDLRLHPVIPRHSAEFKSKMNQRTACERINNTILHTYGIENSKTRGKKRISFFSTMAAINIHLDAQLTLLIKRRLFDFNAISRYVLCA